MTTKVQTSIRKEIKGEIVHVDWNSGYLKIMSADGLRYSVARNRISNANFGHRCIAEKGDAITFLINAEDAVTEVRFVQGTAVSIDCLAIQFASEVNDGKAEECACRQIDSSRKEGA